MKKTIIFFILLSSAINVYSQNYGKLCGSQLWGQNATPEGCNEFTSSNNDHNKGVSIGSMTLKIYFSNRTQIQSKIIQFDNDFFWESSGIACYEDLRINYRKYSQVEPQCRFNFKGIVKIGGIMVGEIYKGPTTRKSGEDAAIGELNGSFIDFSKNDNKKEIEDYIKNNADWMNMITINPIDLIEFIDVSPMNNFVERVVSAHKAEADDKKVKELIKKAENELAQNKCENALNTYLEAQKIQIDGFGKVCCYDEIDEIKAIQKNKKDAQDLVTKGKSQSDQRSKISYFEQASKLLTQSNCCGKEKEDVNKLLEEAKKNSSSTNEEVNGEENSTGVSKGNNSSNSGSSNSIIGNTDSGNNSTTEKSNAEIQQEKQQQAEERERQRQEESRRNGQQIYDNSVAYSNSIEASKREMVNSFNKSIGAAYNNSISYDSYSNAIKSNSKLPESKDPKVLLAAYEEKMEGLEKAFDDRKRDLNAQRSNAARDASQATTLKESAEGLGTLIANTSNQNSAEEKYERAINKLERELKNAFDEIKTDIINTNNQAALYYSKQAVTCYSEEEESFSLKKAAYHECVVEYTNRYFSYGNSSWVNNNCSNVATKTFNQNYRPTDSELYQTAIRKSKSTQTGFNEAANNYIDMAINKNPYESDYYYFKSTISNKLDVKGKCLKMALDLNPENALAKAAIDEINAKEEACYQKAKNGYFVQDYEKYYNDFPEGKYIEETKKVLEGKYFSTAENYFFETGSEAKAKIYYNKYLETFPTGEKATKIKKRLAEIDLTQGQAKSNEINRLNTLADDLEKEGNRAYARGGMDCIGIGLIPAGVVMIIGGSEEWQYNHNGVRQGKPILTVGGGISTLLGILCIPFATISFENANYKFQQSENYRKQAKALTFNFSPAVNPLNKSCGLTFRMNFN